MQGKINVETMEERKRQLLIENHYLKFESKLLEQQLAYMKQILGLVTCQCLEKTLLCDLHIHSKQDL
jgi:hypothetical protein